jgi:hypothetical protein
VRNVIIIASNFCCLPSCCSTRRWMIVDTTYISPVMNANNFTPILSQYWFLLFAATRRRKIPAVGQLRLAGLTGLDGGEAGFSRVTFGLASGASSVDCVACLLYRSSYGCSGLIVIPGVLYSPAYAARACVRFITCRRRESHYW